MAINFNPLFYIIFLIFVLKIISILLNLNAIMGNKWRNLYNLNTINTKQLEKTNYILFTDLFSKKKGYF